MKHKLNPCLYNATLDLRKNLWQVFVAPLFEYSLPLYFYEEATTKKQKLERILRGSFKKFTGLAKTVDTGLIDDLMGYNLKDRSAFIQYISKKNGNIEKKVKDTHQSMILTRRRQHRR